MVRIRFGWAAGVVRVVAVSALLAAGMALGETVKQLPDRPVYVNDYAGVLSQETQTAMTQLCRAVNLQAQARIAVVTLKTIEADGGGEISIEEFATALEDKWKVGAKGTDRGVLMILVMTPRRGRIEVGYGLEGILNDAKVGDIGREMSPYAQKNDYDDAVRVGVKDLAGVIAADKGVTLDTTQGPQYRRVPQQQPMQLSMGQVLVGGGVVLLILIVLASTGNLGVVFWLLLNLMGGGGGRGGWGGGGGGGWSGGGGGGGNDDSGSGFGGGSGGGGASGDF